MTRRTILIADNNPSYIQSIRPPLEREGYHVVEAHTPDEAIDKLTHDSNIDLALIDLRLTNDRDASDFSGLRVANEAPGFIPKIIFTNFPTVEAARAALGTRYNGPPPAVDFLMKSDRIDTLLATIERAFWHMQSGLLRAQKENFETTRVQARVFFWISVVSALAGIVLFFISIYYVLSGRAQEALPGVLGTPLVEVISLLIYRRVDKANARVDQYYRQLQAGQNLEQLLAMCDKVNDPNERDECIQKAIQAARQTLFEESLTDGGAIRAPSQS